MIITHLCFVSKNMLSKNTAVFVWMVAPVNTIIDVLLSAVCPYLALETCRQWRLSTKAVSLMRTGKMPTVTIEQAQRNFCKVYASLTAEIIRFSRIIITPSSIGCSTASIATVLL